MDDSCYCDFERPELYEASRPIARKEHRCYECNRKIAPGERYERVNGKWDDFESLATCYHCLAIREEMEAHLPCFCYTHGGLSEELNVWMIDCRDELQQKSPGVAFKILWWLNDMRKTRTKK